MIKKIMKKIVWNIITDKKRIEILRKRGVKIGDKTYIEKNVVFGSEPYLISIGDNVRITSNVKFITHDGGMWVARNLGILENADKFGKINIGNNVNIGWNVILMPGVNVGSNCIIGAGAIVTKDIPNNSVAAGVPARVISSINEYCEKNRDKVDFTKRMTAKEKRIYLEKNIIYSWRIK